MAWNTQKLDKVEKAVKAKKRATATVRELLSWFDSKRRGSWVVATIRDELTRRGLETEPDFASAWFDGEIAFVARALAKAEADDSEPEEAPGLPTSAIPRVGALLTSQDSLVSVTRDATLEEATTLMMLNDFSQLPVMPTTLSRTHHGMISWRSIGQARLLTTSCAHVRDCLEPAESVSVDASIYAAIDILRSRDAVLVRNVAREIVGILTTADITSQFRTASEPFLLIGEIETQIRRLIERRFPKADLASWKDPADQTRVVNGASSLTFGEYIRGLEQPEQWKRLALSLDRPKFLGRLRDVKRIRNEVMHFHPDALSTEDLATLRLTSEVLQRLALATA